MKTNRRARRCTTPPDSPRTHRRRILFVVVVLKKMRLSLKNGRNPPFFDYKKGVNFILFFVDSCFIFSYNENIKRGKEPHRRIGGNKKGEKK